MFKFIVSISTSHQAGKQAQAFAPLELIAR
jgi:hypothetical protein